METLGLTRSLVDDLRTLIIMGEFAPGSKINEIRLASDLGISRSPLREALRTLENERLIVNIHRRGSFVAETSQEDLTEMFQIREMIECYAITLLEEKKIRDLPHVLVCAENSYELSVPEPDDSPRNKLTYIHSMTDYHLKLLESSGNRQLLNLFQTINSKNNRYVYMNIFKKGTTKHRLEDHFQIIEFIKEKKYKDARQLMKIHIRFNLEELKRKMDEEEVKSREQAIQSEHKGSIREYFPFTDS